MKTNLILVGMLLVGLFAVSFAMADDSGNKCFGSTDGISKCSANESVNEIDASLNESVNGWKIGWQNTKIAFTFNKEKKAEMELKLADMRLIQAKIAAKNNNSIAMEKALFAHEKILVRVQERVKKIDGASDEKGVRNSAEKLVGLDRAIEVHQIKIDRLNALLQNENLTSDEKTRIESMLAKAENSTVHLQEVQDMQKEKIQTRLMAIGNMTENESKKVISGIEDAQNLKELKQFKEGIKEGHGSQNGFRAGKESKNDSEDELDDDLNETEED